MFYDNLIYIEFNIHDASKNIIICISRTYSCILLSFLQYWHSCKEEDTCTTMNISAINEYNSSLAFHNATNTSIVSNLEESKYTNRIIFKVRDSKRHILLIFYKFSSELIKMIFLRTLIWFTYNSCLFTQQRIVLKSFL